MRKFRFVGNPKEYTPKGDPQPFIVGHIYNFDFIGLGCVFPISEYISSIGNRDWQEVFEESTLQDRIQELKDFAKCQGLKVDVVVDKVDIWEGVEFIECDGVIIKIKSRDYLGFYHPNGFIGKKHSGVKPSTESAYVEQLKKESFERFGEIKEGDRFELPSSEIYKISNINFSYDKSVDFFRINGVAIYQSGKWAKKLPKRVDVEFNHHIAVGNFSHHTHSFSLDIPRDSSQFEPIKAGKFLAKQLEKYLNGEVE